MRTNKDLAYEGYYSPMAPKKRLPPPQACIRGFNPLTGRAIRDFDIFDPDASAVDVAEELIECLTSLNDDEMLKKGT